MAIGLLRRVLPAVCLFAATSCGTKATQVADDSDLPGVTVSSPQEQGMLMTPLQNIERRVEQGDFGQTRSLIVIRDNSLVLENYYGGTKRSDLRWIASVTKSVTSLLVGIAIGSGEIASTDAQVVGFFPEYQLRNLTDSKRAMTIQHLLTMSSGLRWIEWSDTEPNRSLNEMRASDDWVKFVLDQPMAGQPGAAFNYNSGSTNVLGVILRKAVGKSVEQYAEERLFGPLMISDYTWDWDKGDITATGGGLHLRPLDMAKIGLLFLNRGSWNNQRILDSTWIDESSRPRFQLWDRTSYGYLWYKWKPYLGLDEIIIAHGFGRQDIYVVPEFRVVCALTSDDFGDGTNEPERRYHQLDLLMGLLSLFPDYRARMHLLYDRVMTIGPGGYEDRELMSLANTLITYEEHSKALDVLRVAKNETTARNWYYWYLNGKALYQLGDSRTAADCLRTSIGLNPNGSLQEREYVRLAQELLARIGSSG